LKDETPDQLSIRESFAKMPYGGGANLSFGPMTLGRVAANLKALRRALELYAEVERETRQELEGYRAAFNGLRLFIDFTNKAEAEARAGK
jgi:hypothetical protein